jgi:hypothetical protein
VDVSELPLRPLTSAEVLDAATGVLRHRPWRLLGAAALLAALEQLVLYPMRRSLPDPHAYLADLFGGDTGLGALWPVIAVGLGTEAVILALLGTIAARSAAPLIAGRSASALPARRPAAAVLALVVGAVAGVAAYLGGVGWLIWFMFSGAAAPVLVIDQVRGPFAALERAVSMAPRSPRSGGVRLLAYLPWLVLRLVLTLSGSAVLLGAFDVRSDTVALVLDYVAFIAVNTIAYATMACVDAVAHVETRIRLEGLDIALARATATGAPDPTAVLRVTR